MVPRILEEYQLKVEIVGTLTYTSENRLWASGRTLADKPCDRLVAVTHKDKYISE